MKNTKETYKAVFLATYTQYRPISEATNFSLEERRLMKFKALDPETGNIYLIDHPDAWRSEHDIERRTTYYRMPPKMLATFEVAQKEMNQAKQKRESSAFVPSDGQYQGAGF